MTGLYLFITLFLIQTVNKGRILTRGSAVESSQLEKTYVSYTSGPGPNISLSSSFWSRLRCAKICCYDNNRPWWYWPSLRWWVYTCDIRRSPRNENSFYRSWHCRRNIRQRWWGHSTKLTAGFSFNFLL